jgi:hypothetical protein
LFIKNKENRPDRDEQENRRRLEMASPLKSTFAKKAATAAIGVTASMLFACAAGAEAPPVGSPQWNMSRPYKDFIVHMHNRNGGWCCDLSDGRADMEERIVDGHYQVHITREAFEYDDTIPPEGKWVDIPDNKVLRGEDAERVCKPIREGNPGANTCKQPPFNILWRSKYGTIYCYWPKPQLG